MYQPLADKIRPLELDDMVGQQHIIGPDGLLRRILESGQIPNMIFYGPSGVGKTTLAQIIANKTDRRLVKLNATTASTADIKGVVSELDTLLAPQGVLLYLDEIQYFNKKQQQSLLEFIESGNSLRSCSIFSARRTAGSASCGVMALNSKTVLRDSKALYT